MLKRAAVRSAGLVLITGCVVLLKSQMHDTTCVIVRPFKTMKLKEMRPCFCSEGTRYRFYKAVKLFCRSFATHLRPYLLIV